MSYILEALKKSQDDRELGQVPRVEGFGIDVPIAAPRRHPWAYLALLAGLALLGIAGYLLIRSLGAPPQPTSPAQVTTPLPIPAAAPMPSAPPVAEQAAATAPLRAPTPAETATTAQTAAGASAADGGTPDAPMPLDAPESLSIEPQVLVVPAAAEDGEPLPRGAEELRRAALGDGERISASVDVPRVSQGSTTEPLAPGTSVLGSSDTGGRMSVPEDVLAEIEAFKELVRQRDPDALARAAAAPPPLPEPPGLKALRAEPRLEPGAAPLPPPPSLDLRNRLPPFSMNVHVYNGQAERRFVYINGRKLSEGQESREGIRVEQVVADGAVLSYGGEPFFHRR